MWVPRDTWLSGVVAGGWHWECRAHPSELLRFCKMLMLLVLSVPWVFLDPRRSAGLVVTSRVLQTVNHVYDSIVFS